MLGKKSGSGNRTHVDHFHGGLKSVKGACDVINSIRARRIVKKLVLGHNQLEDAGTVALFTFLGSNTGRTYRIAEISLNSNSIGDAGLLAIASYLNGDNELKELFLQNNIFKGSRDVPQKLAQALNHSTLEILTLTTNPALGDAFIDKFLPHLDTPWLRELHLSSVGLTSLAAPTLIEYLTSPRCRLHTIKLNGNSIGFRGVRTIVRAIERGVYGLTFIEVFANYSSNESESEDGEEGENVKGTHFERIMRELKPIITRNSTLTQRTRREALALLPRARALLLTKSTSGSSATPSKFLQLPPELQLHVFSMVAPTLSLAQRVRIYTYAATHSTLPQLLPTLVSRMSALGVSQNVNTNSIWPIEAQPREDQFECVPDPSAFIMPSKSCGEGICMREGSMNCHRDQQGLVWLKQIGCSTYESETT